MVLLQRIFHSSHSLKYLIFLQGHILKLVETCFQLSLSLSAMPSLFRGLPKQHSSSQSLHTDVQAVWAFCLFGNSLQIHFPHLPLGSCWSCSSLGKWAGRARDPFWAEPPRCWAPSFCTPFILLLWWVLVLVKDQRTRRENLRATNSLTELSFLTEMNELFKIVNQCWLSAASSRPKTRMKGWKL